MMEDEKGKVPNTYPKAPHPPAHALNARGLIHVQTHKCVHTHSYHTHVDRENGTGIKGEVARMEGGGTNKTALK